MAPFSVLHVCMGNICRSPMAERLLMLRTVERAGDAAEELIYSHSCGIGHWHVGQKMNQPAARELRNRGGSDAGFRARHIAREQLEMSDLVLTATHEQYDYVAETFPDALDRTFLIRHFGAIVSSIDPAELPFSDGSPDGIYTRGLALVALAHRNRAQHSAAPLDDPWGEDRETFTRIGDEIDAALAPVVETLLS